MIDPCLPAGFVAALRHPIKHAHRVYHHATQAHVHTGKAAVIHAHPAATQAATVPHAVGVGKVPACGDLVPHVLGTPRVLPPGPGMAGGVGGPFQPGIGGGFGGSPGIGGPGIGGYGAGYGAGTGVAALAGSGALLLAGGAGAAYLAGGLTAPDTSTQNSTSGGGGNLTTMPESVFHGRTIDYGTPASGMGSVGIPGDGTPGTVPGTGSTPGMTNVPEPSSLVLMCSAIVISALFVRRRRHRQLKA